MTGGVDRRRALALLAGLGAAGLASACGAVGAPEPASRELSTVGIGLLVPGTGGYKPLGDDMIRGFRHYLNTNGDRLGGHPVETVPVDEGDTADSALSALDKLLDEQVQAIVGVASSAAMLAISERIEAEHVPLLGTNASPSDMPGNPYVWRTSYVNHEPGEALGRYLARHVDGQVAILAQDDPMGVDVVAGLREAFGQAQISHLLAEPVFTPMVGQPASDHFAPVLETVRATDPEVVFACYAGTAALEFVRQYLAAGLDPARLTGPAYLTEGILGELDDSALGIRTAASYAPELRTAANRAFSADYRHSFGEPPSIYAVAAYDAAAALDKAIALSDGDPTPGTINVNLARVGLIDSPRGRWQFNQSRTPTQKWYLRELGWDGPVLSNVVLQDLGIFG